MGEAVSGAVEFGADLLGFGGGDALAAAGIGGGDALAAGAGAGTGFATIGAGVGGDAALTGGLGDIVGTGAGLAGGTTGLEGSLLAGGATGGLDAAIGTGVAGGALGTAESFLANPAASAFSPTAVGGATAFSDALPAGATPTSGTGTPGAPNSVFNTGTTGTTGITGVNGAGAPSVVPGGGGAAALQAPAGVSGVPDATSVAGAAGPTSTGGAPLGAAPAAPATSIDSLIGKAGNGVIDSLTKNPLGVGLGAAGLGYNILQGQKNTANQKALAADANTATTNSTALTNSGEALQQYLTNGTLPPAYQTQVDQAIADAKTNAISNAAQQGQPTDPTQNTALATTLAKIDASRAGMQAQVASQLFSSGSSLVSAGQNAAGLSGQLFQSLVANDTTQAANTGKAIATLAAALNGKSQNTAGNITVSTG